jgi:hypothetical protein
MPDTSDLEKREREFRATWTPLDHAIYDSGYALTPRERDIATFFFNAGGRHVQEAIVAAKKVIEKPCKS